MSILLTAAACRTADTQSGTTLNCGGAYEVYLTFDDGPAAGTDDVLANLYYEESGQCISVPATFFVCGYRFRGDQATLDERRGWLNSMLSEGHLIGNHSVEHDKQMYGEPDLMIQDFKDNEATMQEEFERQKAGSTYEEFVRHARLPTQNAWRVDGLAPRDDAATVWPKHPEVASDLDQRGYEVFGWDAEWFGDNNAAKAQENGQSDWFELRQSPSVMATEVLDALKAGRTMKPCKIVVLTHDHYVRNSRSQAAKLSEFIRLLREEATSRGKQVTFHTLRDY